jgi:Uma2 family endonuclease
MPMSAAAAARGLSPQEYLELERQARHKSEYFAGRIYAMTGASEAHNLIVGNVIRELGTQLKRRPCKVYPSDMRVKISATGLYTYPDVVVVCGRAELEDERTDTLLNPVVLVEVLSRSTESYDRGEKFEHYRRLESLRDYVLIPQDEQRIQLFSRTDEGLWVFSEAAGPEGVLSVPSIGCELAAAEVYDKLELPEGRGAPRQP